MEGGGIKKGWHKVLKKWGGINEGGIRFLGGGIKEGDINIWRKLGGGIKKVAIKKKPVRQVRDKKE